MVSEGEGCKMKEHVKRYTHLFPPPSSLLPPPSFLPSSLSLSSFPLFPSLPSPPTPPKGARGKVKLKVAAPLISKENGYLSRAVFKRITLEPRMYLYLYNVMLHVWNMQCAHMTDSVYIYIVVNI